MGNMGAPIAAKPTKTNEANEAYPSFQQNIYSAQTEASNNIYPAPGETTNMYQTSDCSKVGTWVEYINKAAGFSFQYPAEAKLKETVDNNGYTSIDLFLQPECYAKEWWGPNQVSIMVLDNTEKLTIEDFVSKQYSINASTEYSISSQELAESSEAVSIDQVTAIRVNGKLTRETPQVYIPNNDLVIVVGLIDMNMMPPFEPACPATLDLYNKILTSVKFLKY